MHRTFKLLTFSILLTLSSWADIAETTAFIAFKGTSTLHDFEGTAASQPFVLTFKENPETRHIQISADAALKVSAMSTDHKKRDKNMFKMLDHENFSLISGSLSEASFPISGNGNAKLKLIIRDIEKTVEANFSNWKREGNKISVDMKFSVSLTSFGLKPPSVMGVIRVGDTVTVECEVEGTCL